MIWLMGFASLAFHTNNRLSVVPAATTSPLGLSPSPPMFPLAPVKTRTSLPVASCTRRTVLSPPPDSNVLPSGDRNRLVTAAAWAGRRRGATGGTCHHFNMPSSPTLYAAALFGLKTTALAAAVWAPTAAISWPLAAFQKRTVL